MIVKQPKRRTSVRIKALVHDRFRAYCLKHRANQTTVLEDALERFLVCPCRCCRRARIEL